MIKRPKPGETEEDLLEFQRQFLSGQAEPSARVVVKPGGKRKPTDSDQASADSRQERDVVQLDDLPEKPPQTQNIPPAKKSRFKALAEERKKQTGEYADQDTKDVVDDLDTSPATVLTKIIERDTRNMQVGMPSPVILHCPVVESGAVSSQSTQASTSTGRKKKSLFSQKFAENPAQFGSFSTSSVHLNMDVEMPQEIAEERSSVVDGTGLSATFGKMEVEKIHQENEKTLAKMSSEEIIEEQQKLLQTLDPKLVDFLKSRKSKKVDAVSNQETVKLDIPIDKKITKPKAKEKQDIPVTVKKEWINMNKIEYDKMEWMSDLPPPSAGDSKTGQQARFDFQGNILPADVDLPVNMGLHHHGDEPERAGYNLGELFQLARSSNIQQRTLALQVLGRIITQAKEGKLAEVVQTPILPSILDAGVIFLLRWSLDDSTDAVVISAVAALNALLVNQADEMMLDSVFHWGQGHRVVCQAPMEPEDSGIKLPDVSDEKPEETDAEIARRDLVLGLVSRMSLLQRLKYILEVTRPQAPTIIAVLQILIRIVRHSPTVAYQVSICPGLIDLIVKNFLPISWAAADLSQPLSRVYGVPLSTAMKLIRTLCQAGRNMASSVLSKYDLTSLFTRYLAVSARDLNLPPTEAYRLQIETLNTWKICLCYGSADSLYLDLYRVIVNELRTCQSLFNEESLAETKLSALIGLVECVLCVATGNKQSIGFKHSQDGVNMEVERSEDVPLATVNWSHVADLIQPIKALLTKLLENVASTYHMKKTSLQLPATCCSFLTTYFARCQSQLSGSELLKVLEEMVDVYRMLLQQWSSPGFISVRSAVSQFSNILSDSTRNKEVADSLQEYGTNDSSVTKDCSPYSFLCSYMQLVYTLCKQNKGILAKGKTSESHIESPAVILRCEYLWSYLRKIAQGKFSHLQSNYFTKIEYHLHYHFLKLATIPGNEEVLRTLDLDILHAVALNLLTGVQYGDEHLVHDLLSTAIYQPTFWLQSSEEKASIHISELSISETTTNLKSATEQEIDFKQEDLVKEAQANLINIRSTYLASLQHFQKPLMQSRNHFMRNVAEVDSCFTCRINENLMPKDWMFLPLIELYNEYSSVCSEVQNTLSSTQVGMVSSVLQWIYLLELYRPVVMNSISVTMKISRIMCTFLTGSDLFLDRRVYCFLAGFLKLFTKPSVLDKLDFTQTIPGLTSFYDLYISLLQQYEAVSFGDWLFGCYILVPLQQRHSLQYRKAIWTEFSSILRILRVPGNRLLIPVKQFLKPEETNTELIRLYFQSLIGGTLRHTWSPVLYLMAVHHVNRFMYTQDGSHRKLKHSMLSTVLKSTNEELKQHLIFYKKTDISKQCGLDLYEELPQIRQNFVSSVSSSVSNS